jgi:acyl-coenzyme A synthetase/AMP-(fatty) acid ligase
VNLVDAFLAQVSARPDAPAIVTGNGQVHSFAQLAQRSAARAWAMEATGIGQGDIVLVARGVSAELYEVLLAIFRLGAVAMFPEPAAGLNGLRLAVEAARPKAVATTGLGRVVRRFIPGVGRLKLVPDPIGREPKEDRLASTPDDAPALITFTSGSTGRPKGIVRSGGFLMLQHTLLENLRQTRPGDVDLISLPIFILSNLAAGATSVIPAGRLTRPGKLDGARLRQQIEEHGVNRIVAPPSVCARIVDGAAPMPGLTAVFTGGGPVFPNLLRAVQCAAPNAAVHAVYGSTEAEPIAHVEVNDVSDADWQAMADGEGLLAGHPTPETAVDLRDGEVFVAGRHVNEGYLDPADDASTKSRKNGRLWHRTGDAARMDNQGRLWLLGRKDAASDGLYPFAVETAALSWPGVRQAALLAGGTAAKLAVAGAGLDAADLQARAARLGDIQVVVLNSVPMDNRHNAKADYARLRKMLE